jgi:hypothetical protein
MIQQLLKAQMSSLLAHLLTVELHIALVPSLARKQFAGEITYLMMALGLILLCARMV